MTTIEETKRYIEIHKEKNRKDEKETGRVCLLNRLQLEYYEKVLKDLEILEILKEESNLIWLGKDTLYIGRFGDIHIPLDEDDFSEKENYEKVKHWLEGEKK